MSRFLNLLLLALPATAFAHYPWVAPADLRPAPGEALALRVDFGHDPASARALATDRLRATVFHAADGSEQTVRPVDAERLRVADVGVAGAALLAGRQKPGFWSRTPEGGKRASRSDAPDASHCSRSDNGFKALLAVGGETGDAAAALDRRLGHSLELVTSRSPAGLAESARLPLRLFFEGEPLADHPVKALPLDSDGEAIEAFSDSEGRLALALPAGKWLLHAEHARPFPDPAVCDEESFHATLVLERP